MSNPAPPSTPPSPDSLRHTSASPDEPDPVKKRSLSTVGSDPTENGSKMASTGAAGPARKRTKLTEFEREARERGRLERERERLAKRAERDKQKRIRDEEKRKKEDEKAKKEKAQSRLGSFFTKPAIGREPQSTPPSANTSAQTVADSPPPRPPPDVKLKRRERTDYERSFQPFFVKPNVIVAPIPFQRDDNYKLAVKSVLDNALSLTNDPNFIVGSESDTGRPASAGVGEILKGELVEELMHIPCHKRVARGKPPKYSTKDILTRINTPDSSLLPPLANLEGVNPNKLPTVYLDLLNSLPCKFLQFAEDVRPPYSGTYTRKPVSSGLLRGRNPFQKSLPRVDYGYDSEAEWGEDGLDCDGEELLSDEEDDEDGDSCDEDLEEFLDDEDEEGASKNRRGVVSALIPICSGLCWEDPSGKTPRKEFEEMSLAILIAPSQPLPAQAVRNPTKAMRQFFQQTGNRNPQTAMPPPAPPARTAQATAGERPKKAKPKHLIPAEDMAAFKQAIEGSDLTKAALIEHLKKIFPQLNKEAIKNSLGQVAQRRGQTERDKSPWGIGFKRVRYSNFDLSQCHQLLGSFESNIDSLEIRIGCVI
ncbi:hypothetical protein C7212DRAFT_362268 [Tuber magnatum]|uniref:Chromatin assembly factor 1 subunit A n=1 Tax=Tuber magnatum TaxID=42249 RepID=A0A317SVW5_9PEZI|nr:hypothetical protein C7212DRAFT_362268 [Tuber magnatum]